MSAQEIEAYLNSLAEPKRSTLQTVRERILAELPDAEEGLAYQLPAFRVSKKVIAGFAAFTKHLSYLPHSGSVIPRLVEAGELAGYTYTPGSLHFPVDQPLPAEVVRRLIEVRMEQAFAS